MLRWKMTTRFEKLILYVKDVWTFVNWNEINMKDVYTFCILECVCERCTRFANCNLYVKDV